MIRGRRGAALLGLGLGLLLALCCPAPDAAAQAVSCTGVAPWNSATIYNPGDRLVFEGKLYEARVQIWNTPPTHCASCGWYLLLGTCGAGGNTPPTAALTSPANGATFAAGTNIDLAADASDGDGSIVKVEFFQGSTKLGEDGAAPYGITWSNVPAGSYTLKAVATDNGGATGSSATRQITVTGGSNAPPTVSLTAPASGATFNAGADIAVSANAADPDGSVTRVEFFQGSTSIGVDTTAPYGITWSRVPAGSYTLKAVATDNGGASGTSATRQITVTGGGGCDAPQYAAGTAYAAGQQVQNGGELFRCDVAGWCSADNPAYEPGVGWAWQTAWTRLGPCDDGNRPPTAALTSPQNGARFSSGSAVTLSADASDPDGTVAKVEFFAGSTKLGEDGSAPYGVTWNAPDGSHQLTAKATDSGGKSATSAAVTITVGNPPPASRKILVGYWHNFNNGSGFIKLRNVSSEWDVIQVAFAEPRSGSTSDIQFIPDAATSAAELKADIQTLKAQGKKVLISIGGANGHVELPTAAARAQFVSSMKAIISEYGFNGMDIDFEGQSLRLNRGDRDVKNPTTPVIVNLISAIREIRNHFGAGFMLTMAPETFFVQVGYQFYGGIHDGADPRTGAYLPVIHATRDILTYLHVQHYNSGPVMALDDVQYQMGNADFHVAMAEMVMRGFPAGRVQSNFFPGLREDQVLIGLPATVNAGNGFTSAAEVQKAVNYLARGISFGGAYRLRNPAGYPGFKGLMSWSINWDQFGSFSFSRPHRQFLNGLP